MSNLSAVDDDRPGTFGNLEGVPRLRGRVVSGIGSFGFWIERLNTFYAKKTGMRLYPGTLNIELPAPYSLPSKVMRLVSERVRRNRIGEHCAVPDF